MERAGPRQIDLLTAEGARGDPLHSPDHLLGGSAGKRRKEGAGRGRPGDEATIEPDGQGSSSFPTRRQQSLAAAAPSWRFWPLYRAGPHRAVPHLNQPDIRGPFLACPRVESANRSLIRSPTIVHPSASAAIAPAPSRGAAEHRSGEQRSP